MRHKLNESNIDRMKAVEVNRASWL